MRVGSRSGVPFWQVGERAPDHRQPGGEDRLDVPVPDHVHVDERRVRPEDAQLPEVDEPRAPQARLHGRGHVEVVAEVGVDDDALAVGERLGRLQELVGGRALAVERDVAVDDAVGIPVAMELPAQELERPLAGRRHAREQARALEPRDHVHQRRIVPEIRIGEGAPDARGLGGGGDGVRLERAARLDERGVAVAQELETPERGRRLLVLRPERGLPVGVVRSRPAAPAAVPLEEAPAGLGVDVEMGVDEPRVHDPAAGVEDARGAPAREHLRLRPDRDDRVASHRDGSGGVDRAPGVERQDLQPPSGSGHRAPARWSCGSASPARRRQALTPGGALRRQRSRTSRSTSTPRPGPSGG